MTAPLTATLVGCGDLGARVGLGLAERGVAVTAIRRRADLVPAPLRGLSADLTGDEPLPDLTADLLVVCLTADDRDEGGYRRTYVDGMGRALEAATRSGMPQRAVLVSSTSVFGDGDGVMDETTEPQPSRATSRVLLEAEQAFVEAIPHGSVARLSGLYGNVGLSGPRPPRVVTLVRRGEDPDPGAWTNRVHRDDGAAAVVHLLTQDVLLQPLYVVTDDEPCTAGELRAFVADHLGVPWSAADGPRHGKRLSNARIRATGWVPQYPSYREGYAALLG